MRRHKKRSSGSKSKKKAQTTMDLIFVLIFLVGFAIASVFGYKVFTDINNDIQSDTSMTNTSKEVVSHLHSRYPATLDSLFAVALVLFWIFTIVSSFLIDSHPIFFIVSFILLLFTFVAMALLSNAYQEIMQDAEISGSAASFPITGFFITHLVETAVVMGLSILLALYGKAKYS